MITSIKQFLGYIGEIIDEMHKRAGNLTDLVETYKGITIDHYGSNMEDY